MGGGGLLGLKELRRNFLLWGHLAKISFLWLRLVFGSASRMANMNQHMRYNHVEKLGITLQVYRCEHCGKECKTKTNLRQHIESAHSDSPNPKYK